MRVWAVALPLFGVVMALGNQHALYRLIAGNVDLVAEFRVPARYLLLAYFALAAAAALGTDALLQRDLGGRGARARQGLGGLAVVGLVLGFALVVGGHSDRATAAAGGCWPRRARRAGLAAAGFRGPAGWRSPWSCSGSPRVELQQARPAAEYHQVVPDAAYDDHGPVMERLGREGGRYVSIAWDRPTTAAERRIPVPPRPGSAHRMRRYYREALPAAAGRPAGLGVRHQRRDHLRPRRRAAAAPHLPRVLRRRGEPAGRLTAGVHRKPPSRWNWAALDLLGVRWFVTDGLPPGRDQGAGAPRLPGRRRDAFFLLWKRPAPPLARCTTSVDVVPDPAERLARLAGRLPAAGAGHGRAAGGRAGPAGRPADVQVRPARPDPGRGSVRTDAVGLLVLADPWYPQWRVDVDGQPAELLRADHAFRGVGCRPAATGWCSATRTGPCRPAWPSAC